MSHITKDLLSDCSTPDAFVFSLCCAECGSVWKSTPVLFSRAGVVPETEGKREIYNALYRKEWEAALSRAVTQAEQAFNLCPICERLVCDRCFLVCDDLDLCSDCASRLQEQGSPVAKSEKARP